MTQPRRGTRHIVLSPRERGWTAVICSDKTGTITEGRVELTHVLPALQGSRERALDVAAHASQPGTGDPLDTAVLALAGDRSGEGAVLERFPFTEDRKRETVILPREGALLVATKGSHEVVLALCAMDTRERADWERRAVGLALEGHKVIEVRPRGVHKGLADGRVRAEAPAGTVFVAIGDDVTDEDMFAALQPCDIAVSVVGGRERRWPPSC